MRVGNFYLLNNTVVKLYYFSEIAYFHINGDIIGKDFCKLEGILFDENWKSKVSSKCALKIKKHSFEKRYFSKKFVHEVQRDYFNDFHEELEFDDLSDESRI